MFISPPWLHLQYMFTQKNLHCPDILNYFIYSYRDIWTFLRGSPKLIIYYHTSYILKENISIVNIRLHIVYRNVDYLSLVVLVRHFILEMQLNATNKKGHLKCPQVQINAKLLIRCSRIHYDMFEMIPRPIELMACTDQVSIRFVSFFYFYFFIFFFKNWFIPPIHFMPQCHFQIVNTPLGR